MSNDDDKTIPILVAKDNISMATMSMLVPAKGDAAPWVHKSIIGP